MPTMTPRQRIVAALSHQSTDVVPFDFGNHLCFWGRRGFGHDICPWGTAGPILAACDNVQADVSADRIDVTYRVVLRYGAPRLESGRQC